MSKRSLTRAAAVCLCVLTIARGVAGAAAAPAGATPAWAAAASTTAAPSASGDAAAKHAKRTACLKDAKAKKLVGAAKTSFVKICVAAP
ncbi:MAG: hypothetical protein ABJD53_07650 [Gammaproteobacteria bacterium]